MKIEKLPSGSYRIRKTRSGKTYTLILDHKPGKRESEDLMNELISKDKPGEQQKNKLFKNAAEEYILIKTNVLSPSTIRGYKKILDNSLSEEFKNLNIFEINQINIQIEINRLAIDKSPKTVRNIHGFISAVLGLYNPEMTIHTTLPQKVKYEPYIPTEDDIKKLIKATENDEIHIAIQLGCLGMRRSEICALTKNDIDGNYLNIEKAYIQKEDNTFEIQMRNKTTDGKRKIYIPDHLRDEMLKADAICSLHPNSIIKILYKYQKQLGIPQFRFHDLRHFYCSYAHENGMSDADIMATGGWKSDYTMKSVYRHSMEKSKTEKQKEIAAAIFS